MPRTWTVLKQRADFLRLAASGRRKVTPAFILQADSPAAGTGRIGFTVSKKVGNAVARNRAKRRLRAIADLAMGAAVPLDLDFVLIGRTDALTRDFAAMVDDLKRAMTHVTKNDAGARRGGPRRDEQRSAS